MCEREGCEYAPPELLPENAFAWAVRSELCNCRTGDGTYLDSGAVLQVLRLMGLDEAEVLDAFGRIQVVEGEFLRETAERMRERMERK